MSAAIDADCVCVCVCVVAATAKPVRCAHARALYSKRRSARTRLEWEQFGLAYDTLTYKYERIKYIFSRVCV